jgi:LysR family nod box-dependent transcriptional activator
MDLHLFDLNLLVALDALLTERNVTRAGNRLNLSQAAMSGALARLRHYFHDELLVPVGRQMALTPVAEGLVEPVRDILLRIRGTLGSKPQFDPLTATRHMSLAGPIAIPPMIEMVQWHEVHDYDPASGSAVY